MAPEAIQIRLAEESDRRPHALLFAAVAEERDGIASEPPVDVERQAANWRLDGALVAVVDGAVVGQLGIHRSSFGYGEIGMMVRPTGGGTASVLRW